MISTLRLQNFGCVRDLTVHFGRFTALVGPNGAGKSTVMRGLRHEFPIDDDSAYQHRPDLEIRAEVRLRDGSEGARGRRRDGNGARMVAFAEGTYGRSWRRDLMRFDLEQLRRAVQTLPAPRLDPGAGNLANVLHTMPPRARQALYRRFCELVTSFADVDVRPAGAGVQWPLFQDRWNESVWFTPPEVSDGSLLMLALLALEHQAQPPDVVCIEEIERGLHPYLLGEVVKHLRAWSERDGGPMIVLATHSAELLDHLAPGEVRFLSRDPASGDVTIEGAPSPSERWDEVMRRYRNSLGSVWLAGGLGGVPA